jgi:hypothetical protein
MRYDEITDTGANRFRLPSSCEEQRTEPTAKDAYQQEEARPRDHQWNGLTGRRSAIRKLTKPPD